MQSCIQMIATNHQHTVQHAIHSSHTNEYKLVISILARSEGILDHCAMTQIVYYFCCQIQKFKICNLSVVYLKIVFCSFLVLLVWHSLRLVTWNLEGKEARSLGQYLFECIASHCKTPVRNTLGPRFCSLYTINVCKSRRYWSILSCQAEIPNHNICIPYTPSKFQLSLAAYWPCYGFETCVKEISWIL